MLALLCLPTRVRAWTGCVPVPACCGSRMSYRDAAPEIPLALKCLALRLFLAHALKTCSTAAQRVAWKAATK